MTKSILKKGLLFALIGLLSKQSISQCGLIYCAPTVEYDNFISGFHQTVVRDNQGKFQIWGEDAANNGATNLTAVTEINSTNFPNLTGTPLKMALGSDRSNSAQFILLTTTGLFAWGNEGNVLNSGVPGTNTSFTKLTTNGDGLPSGVDPQHVKMMFATYQTFAILTCSGDVWVLSQSSSMRGNGGSGDATTWARVKTGSGNSDFLTNIAAIRGNRNALMALTNGGEVYTWGPKTLLGTENSATQSTRNYAAQMTLPTTGSIKMIGVMNDATDNDITNPTTYYVLYSSGALYAMGLNSSKQLGDFGTTSSPSSASRRWVQPRYTSGGTIMNDIKWISTNEHSGSEPAINVINNSDRIWNWGSNDGLMLGRSTTETDYDPGQPQANAPFNPTTSTILGVETGGHTTMIAQRCQTKFGYVGHATNGSASTNADTNWDKFVFSTSDIQICGYETDNVILDPVSTNVTTNTPIQLSYSPTGGTFQIVSGSATVSATGVLTVTGMGSVQVSYSKVGACDPSTVSIVIPASMIKINANNDFNAGVIKTLIPGNVKTNDDVPGATYGTSPLLTGSPSGSNPSITMHVDGTYEFKTDKPGIYYYDVTVCPTGQTTNCPITKLIITVTDPTSTNDANNKPHADLDLGTTKVNTPITLDIRQNDGPGNIGKSLDNPTITDGPSNGTAEIDANGELVYTPNAGFTGKDTVTYQVCDTPTPPSGNCATAIAIITVLPDGINTTSAADDYATTPKGTAITGKNVKPNDVDIEGNNTNVTAQNITVPGKGDFVLNTDGSYTFTPLASFVGTVDLPYTICDNGTPQVCDVATLHIVVYNTTPLSVNFGEISAKWVDGQLVLDWTTLSEKNNSKFEIEISKDGVNFTKIGEVVSKATDGNSGDTLSYDFSKTAEGITVAGLAILGLAFGAGFMRRRKLTMALAAISFMLIGYACTKHDKEIALNSDGDVYIRIAQVDKDGTKSYSKVVKVVKE